MSKARTRRGRAIGAALAALLGAVGCTDSASTPPKANASAKDVSRMMAERLQKALDDGRSAAGSPGAQAAVILANGDRWTGASGFADVDTDAPVETDTGFAMGSAMKLHTAALVLDLAEEGVLSLDHTLARWVPSFPGARGITLRQLLLHTSGLARVAGSDIPAALEKDGDHRLTFEELLLPPVCRPGACYHYQSPDYELLGEVVERATGNQFAHELRTRLWEPLGLDDTFFPSQEEAGGEVATGYGFGPPRPADEVATCVQEDVVHPYPCGGGGLLATAADVASFADALMSGDVLEASSLEELLDFDATRGLPGISECGAVGLGLVRAGDPDDGERWSHGGFTGNFHSSAPYFPRYGVTIAVVVNDDGDTSHLEGALADVVMESAPVVDPGAGTGFCNYDVYVARADGSARTRLTRDRALDGSTITWSPDGRRMAFGSTRTGDNEIYVMDADGGAEINLTDHPADDGAASWSPDGTRIAFHSDRAGTNDIFAMNADGSGVTQLTNRSDDEIVPAWSPDGSQIAYAGGPTSRDHDIFVMDADGSNRRRLTHGGADEWWTSWSPDGSRVAFAADRRPVGGGGIKIVDADGTISTLALDVDGPNFPSWSSNGPIAFVDFPGDIWTVRPDGSDLRRVTHTGEREFQPAWSPDGRRLAFPAERWVDE